VIANGVTINSGATIALSGTAQGQLTQGMVMTLIKNTAATPVNGNNLQASYEGGDGNDLTLTVGSISSGTTRNATHRIAPSSMPLLLSLKTGLLTKAYKHGAPNGALRHCQVCQLFNRAR